MDEQRRAPRKRVFLEGRVIFNNRFSIIECIIRDMSTTGAKIAFQHPTPLPAEVELEIFKTGQNLRAQVMWTDGKMHGLMFINEAKRAPQPTGAAPQPSNAGAIQAIVDEARHRIAEQAGVPPEKVRLRLEIDY